MAATDNTVVNELAPPGSYECRTQLTGASSTHIIRLSDTKGFVFSVEGTNATTCTRSGNTITITGTNDDWVNIRAWGTQ